MAEVLHGKSHGDQIHVDKDKTQAYGLAGNDTLISNNAKDALLIGGSGNDSLIMMGGIGTLSGGKGKDTFDLTYSADNPITAVIEDFEPSKDKISVNFVGETAPQLSSVMSGNDVVWKDSDGLFNLTLKSVRENDYFDGDANSKIWDVLKITNDERELKGLSPLTLSEGLMIGASIRAEEITALGESGALPEYKHTRPSGLSYATVFEEVGFSYHNHGENLDAGADSPLDVMNDWMNSPSHKKNILDEEDKNFQKFGVGYDYRKDDPTEQQHYWVQLFADGLNNPETVSMANLSIAQVNTVSKSFTLTSNTYDNTVYGATIQAHDGDETITNSGLAVSISGGDGADSILSSGSFTTICAGGGNDKISLASGSKENLIQYAAGDGFDTITGFHANDTLSIADSEYTFATVGNDVVVTVGADSITLLDAASLKHINFDGTWSKVAILTEDNDTYNNSIEGITIRARAGDDSITNDAASSFIVGDNGNDFIRNSKADNVLISGGDGKDSIVNTGSSAIIIAEADDDSIQNSGSSVTIEGGFGNDKITLTDKAKDNVIQYKAGDGNDKIYGFDDDDTLNISNAEYATAKSGKNIVVAVGTDSITLAGATTLSTVHIEGKQNKQAILSEGSDTYYNAVEGATINALGGNDSIKNSGANVSICAGGGNDQITLTADAKNNVIQYRAGDGNDYVVGFRADSTLQIGDGNDTYFTFKNGNDIIVRVGKNSITLADAATLSNVHIAGTKSEPADYDKLITLTEDNDIYSNTISGATIEALGGDDTLTNTGANTTIDTGADNDYIENYGHHALVIGGSGNDTLLNLISKGEDTVDNKFITLTEGNDSYYNTVEGATINALSGDDTLENSGASSIIDGGSFSSVISDDDIILTVGDGSIRLIDAAGLSSINIDGVEDTSSSDTKLITLTEGNDTYNNTVEGVTINALGGDDTISNSGASVSIDGGEGNDSINHIAGQYVTILSGAGDDVIDNSGSSQHNDYITINSGTGDDSISNGGHDATINAGDGNDTVENHRDWVVINGGAGADYITTKTGIMAEGHVTINGGSNNDTIINSNPYSDNSIIGGAGSDSILNAGASSTIDGGAGNDIISLASSATDNLIQYSSGDGSDTIYGFNETSTLSIGGGSFSSVISDNDLILAVGEDSITLVDAASLANSLNIDGTEDTTSSDTVGVTINNTLSNTLLSGTSGDDSIQNGGRWDNIYHDGGSNVTINTSAGNDYVHNYRGSEVIIKTGAGNDSVENSYAGDNVTINTGTGNDSVRNYGSNFVTINTGAGNDSIYNNCYRQSDGSIYYWDEDDAYYGKNILIEYSSGDGSDIIYGFKADSTLSISGSYSSETSNDGDLILTVGNGSIVRLVDY